MEDEESIAGLLRSYLTAQGFRIVWVRSGEEALAELDRHPIRVVLLDLGLPGMDGFDVCRQIRYRSKVPLVMVTARDEEIDRVAGLEIGADDYVSKPFSPRELTARLKAVLRRSEDRVERAVLALEDVVLNRERREVTVAGEPRRAHRQGVRPARVPARAARASSSRASCCSSASGASTTRRARERSTCTSRRSAEARPARARADGAGVGYKARGR